MKNFIKNSILFLLMFFIVDKGFYYFLFKAPAREYDKRLDLVYLGKMNKEIIILGSSRGSDNILGGQIQNAIGKSTYNLSYQGCDVIFQYFVLQTLLKFNHKPKMVILLVDNPYEFDSTTNLSFRTDRLLPLLKYNYFNDVLVARKEKTLFSKFFYLGRLNREQITLNQTKKTSIIPIDAYGSMPLLNKKDNATFQFAKSQKDYSKQAESTEKFIAFKNLQSLCLKNKIKLIYVFSPSFMEFNSSFYRRFTTEVDVKNIMVYDSLNPAYRNATYYYDESHLLEKGAKLFTDEIINFIQSKN